MKINADTLLIKAHYFMLFAGMVPVLPFFMVIGVGLGIPIAVQGLVGAIVLIGTVITKPFISLLADTFPRWRKVIFVCMVTCCGLSLGCIGFIPVFGKLPSYSMAILAKKSDGLSEYLNETLANVSMGDFQDLNIRSKFTEKAWVNENFNHTLESEALDYIEPGQIIWSDLFLWINNEEFCVLERGADCSFVYEEQSEAPISQSARSKSVLQLRLNEEVGTMVGMTAYTVTSQDDEVKPYRLGHVSVQCRHGEWNEDCSDGRVWRTSGFWAFLFLMLLGVDCFSTANSFTDAITVETIGPTGNYGSQRAFGSAGWGLMGPVSGLLVDWWSGDSEVKDYTPAFVLVFLLISVDVGLSTRLKVPKIEVQHSVWNTVWPLLRQPRFFLFLFFSVLNGCFDGVVLNFLFVLQEDLASGTEAMRHIKFMQGLTIFVQCALEAPCMHLCNKLVKKMGADHVTTVVLGLYVIRLFLMAGVGRWGIVWLTVAVEVFNGPCYGFGYSAIVVYAGQLSPPGASTTVQSLVNICYESIGYAVCSLISGVIIQELGSVKLFFIWGVAASVTTVFHLLYVKFVPPIKEELINPPLHKRDEEISGTVEEHLYLSTDDEDLSTVLLSNQASSLNGEVLVDICEGTSQQHQPLLPERKERGKEFPQIGEFPSNLLRAPLAEEDKFSEEYNSKESLDDIPCAGSLSGHDTELYTERPTNFSSRSSLASAHDLKGLPNGNAAEALTENDKQSTKDVDKAVSDQVVKRSVTCFYITNV